MRVKVCSSAWLQLLLKPAKWKQEHRGHVWRKDFARPRLIFCYLGMAAFIGKTRFLSWAFFEAVLMGRGNKAQPTATQSQQQDCRDSPHFCAHIHSLLQGSGFSGTCGTKPPSHLPFHRVGSTACSSGLPQQNVYSRVTSSSHWQKWGCHGALLPHLSGGWWARGVRKAPSKDGAIALFQAAARMGDLLLSPHQMESQQRLGLTFPSVLYF